MTMLPTRRQEAWRYADLKRLAPLWPNRAPKARALTGAELKLEDRITGTGWHDEEVEITVAPGGHLRGIVSQTAAPDAIITQSYRITLGAGARADLTLLSHGAAYARLLFDVRLEDGAVFDLGAALVAGGDQNLELITFARHIGPNAVSRQTVRAVAADRSVASYLGQVAVARDAQKTDAAQSFKALLLDRGATANAKPELEIFADDVKCAHGATVGELDRAAMFYMASRGVPPQTAEALLAAAFVDDALSSLPEDEPGRAALAAKLETLIANRAAA